MPAGGHSRGECLTVGRRGVECDDRARDRRSSGASFVTMMGATDLMDGHDRAIAGWCDRARNRRVFVQRQKRARPFVIRAIAVHQYGEEVGLSRIYSRPRLESLEVSEMVGAHAVCW
jgi:hypothetical protein